MNLRIKVLFILVFSYKTFYNKKLFFVEGMLKV